MKKYRKFPNVDTLGKAKDTIENLDKNILERNRLNRLDENGKKLLCRRWNIKDKEEA